MLIGCLSGTLTSQSTAAGLKCMAFGCSMVLSQLLEYSVREGKLSPPGKFGSVAVTPCKNVGPEFNDDCGTHAANML